MRGPLDQVALAHALQTLVDRHESLRTTFEVHDGQPVQRIHPPRPLSVPMVELSKGDPLATNSDDHLQSLLVETARIPFDLSNDLMVRACLFRIHETEHVLLITMHHLACDGWSLRVFFGELSSLYETFTRGEDHSLPALPIQYADFSVWQSGAKREDKYRGRREWWQKRLAGASFVLPLPADRPRPAVRSIVGGFEELAITSSLIERAQEIARREQVTLYAVLLATFLRAFASMERRYGSGGRHRRCGSAGARRPVASSDSSSTPS
ncbi:MAG: condensation domain-containing protein [Planctomycetota bacterium]